MAIDKDWTREGLNRNSDEFKLGLNAFIERYHNNGPDIASTINEPPKDVGPTKDDLEGLIEMANEELFSGCTWMSSLDFLAKMSHIKVFHKMTDTCFDDTMEFLIKCFPKGAKVPKSHYEAKKSMKKVGLGYESIHACVNDYCLFWEKNKDLLNWSNCNAKLPTGLAADVSFAFGNLSRLNGVCGPVILTTYNTPPWICMEKSSFMLTLLIPGPKSPAISDFPARSSLSGWSGQGYIEYPTCNDETPSTRVNEKTAYVCHRRFLPSTHSWRRKKTFNGKNEMDPPPPKLTSSQILRQLAKVPSRTPESLMGTLLMNDKSKDTNKARQDLEELKIRKELWLIHKGNGKFLKPHPIYSFTPEKRRKFCEFIKGVKLPDGFGSNFKPKVTDNDNIIGMKSHDCHIMMQRLLAVGAQAYLDPSIATPIIELCSKFKEAIQGGPVYMRWMYPFERYMKKLKNYVRNKAKLEGSIAEGYVAEEALTFCSHYLKGVQTRFNRPDRNDDGPPPTCEMQVFRSVCQPKSAGVEKKLDKEVKKKLEWYVLDNSPEIDTYKTYISTLRHEKPSECNLELLALAHGLLNYATYYSSCVVNGVKFVVHSHDERLTTQCSGVSTLGEEDGTMFYGVLEEILELQYLTSHTVVLFRCKWFKTNNTPHTQLCVTKNIITSISTRDDWWKHQQYILATQARQVFYLEDPSRSHHWRVIQDVNHRKIWDKDIIVDADVIHDTMSSNLALTTNLEVLDYRSLSEVGPLTEVQYNPTRSLVDDDDFFDEDENHVPHVLSSDSDSDSD
ncbi:uncharacterized protein Tco_0016560 [Tanacetum coccineum]